MREGEAVPATAEGSDDNAVAAERTRDDDGGGGDGKDDGDMEATAAPRGQQLVREFDGSDCPSPHEGRFAREKRGVPEPEGGGGGGGRVKGAPPSPPSAAGSPDTGEHSVKPPPPSVLLLPRVAVNSVDVGDEAVVELLHLRPTRLSSSSSPPPEDEAEPSALPASSPATSPSSPASSPISPCCTSCAAAAAAAAAPASPSSPSSPLPSSPRRRPCCCSSAARRRKRKNSSSSPSAAPPGSSMALTPSCSQDFTRDWVLFIMQQYFEQNFGCTIERIGDFRAERADGLADAEAELRAASGRSSKHVLSQAFKVMVDVPDPPRRVIPVVRRTQSMILEETAKDDGSDNNNVKTPPGAGSPLHSKTHHLFVKIPPQRTAKFERMVRRNRTLEHEVKVYSELLRDLKKFVSKRVGETVQLKIPTLYHAYEDGSTDSHVLVIEDLAKKGFSARDWLKTKLTHDEVTLAVAELARFHACGLAYRMSLKEEIDEKYPYLEDDLYTSNMAKELLAKYLDSFLHFLSMLPGIQEHVLKLRKISSEVFQLLVKLRRPSDPLGTRFNTICHGDMWMGNLMFRHNPDIRDEEEDSGDEGGGAEEGKRRASVAAGAEPSPNECTIIDFHSAQYLSPATDLAHLLLTSTTRAYRRAHWDAVVEHYYDVFNRTLAEFGLVLRHLGTTYQDFLYEVKRALRGQFLCVAFIIPIVIYCGPTEWRFERRRGSSMDRKNTVRHLIQMMAISEEPPQSEAASATAAGDVRGTSPSSLRAGLDLESRIPAEFLDLYRDEELTQTLIDLIETAADLDILDFQEFCKHIDRPKPMWSKTHDTTGKHIPVY